MAIHIIYFNLFSILAVFFSVVLICFKNPVFSIFSLIATLISSILLLLLMQVEFLAYIYLIVYVGAIAVLFLFVVMLLNIRAEENKVSSETTLLDPTLNILLTLKMLFTVRILAGSS
jgi:NADH-quinone oxidoreductase subunit J